MRAMTGLPTVAAVLLVAGSANAAILFELELFDSPGVTTASPGINVTLQVFMSPGPEGVSDLRYDLVSSSGVATLGVNQQVSIAAGTPVSCPSTAACALGQVAPPVWNGNRIDDFNLTAGAFGQGPYGGRFAIGVARFNFAGPDTVSINVTTAFDNHVPGQAISPVNTTTFRIVPEAAVASLLLLGLGGLALAVRRRR